MEKRAVFITCGLCPRGCRVELAKKEGEYRASGNECPKGLQYALNELTHPTRILTTTVKTIFKDFPRLPVKTSVEIPLGDVFKYMAVINTVVVKRRLTVGARIMVNILDTGVDLLATDDMNLTVDTSPVLSRRG